MHPHITQAVANTRIEELTHTAQAARRVGGRREGRYVAASRVLARRRHAHTRASGRAATA